MAREKIALVTGSSSGIGLLTAVELALNGYRVVATMRNLESRGRLEEAAQKAGVRDRLDLRRLDITEFDSLPGAVDAAYELDLAVPSVGIFLHDILASLAAAGRQLSQQGWRWFMRGEKSREPDRRAK